MEHIFTNRRLKISGDSNTVPMTVRVPKEVADFIDSHLTEQIKNRSEFLQHWAQVGVRVSDDEDLDEALDWALDRPVQELVVEARSQPLQKTTFEGPPRIWTEDLIREYKDTVAEVIPPETPQPDELTSLRESQLEALRSRVH